MARFSRLGRAGADRRCLRLEQQQLVAASPAPRRRRLERRSRPPRRPGPPSSRTRTPARPSPTTRSGPAAAATSSSRAARPPSPAATRRFDTTELPKATQRCATRVPAGRDPELHLADRDRLQPLGRRQPAAQPGDDREDLQGRDHDLERPGHQGGQPGRRTCPARRSHRCTARTSPGRRPNFTDYLHGAAPSVWTFDPDGNWPLKGGESGAQTSGVVEAVKAGDGTIGYADDSQAGDLGVAKVKVGNTYVAPSARGCGERFRPVAEGPGAHQAAVRVRVQGRADSDRSEQLPDPAGLVPDRLHEVPDTDTTELVKAYFNYVDQRRGPAGRGAERRLRADSAGHQQGGSARGRRDRRLIQR